MAKKIKTQHKPALGGLAIHDGPDDWNSRVQELLAAGKLEQACALARRGRALWPEHTPLTNNLSLGLSLLGQQDAARRTGRRGRRRQEGRGPELPRG